MIVHDTITLTDIDAPVVFAELMGMSCSVCAPIAMSREAVEAWANEHGPKAITGQWVAIDKSKFGMGQPTPNPCNQVAGRRHWFMLDDLNGALLAGEHRR